MQFANSRQLRTMALAIGVALAATIALAPKANATAVIAATEPTQIMNHVELIAQYEKQVQQAITEMNSYIALEQQLKNMPQSARTQIDSARYGFSSVNTNSLNAAQNMLDALIQSQNAMQDIGLQANTANQVMSRLAAEGHPMTVSQYESGMVELSRQHADTYGVVLNNYKASVAQQQAASEKIQQIAAAAPEITSSVGGLQAVVQSNAVLGQQLSAINANLTTAGVVNAQQAQDSARIDAEIHDQTRRNYCSAANQAYIMGGMSAADRDQACQDGPPEKQ